MGNAMHSSSGIPEESGPTEVTVETRAAKRRRLAVVPVLMYMETRAALQRRMTASTCPICLDGMPHARPVTCEHMFHLECLLEWSAHENSCPICREFFNHIVPGTGACIAVDDAVQVDEDEDD